MGNINEVLELLSELEAKQISLSLKGDKLGLTAPKDALTMPLKQKIKRFKSEIIVLLGNKENELPVNGYSPIAKTRVQPNYALSNAQRRLWVLDQLETGQNAYNIPEAIRITGSLNTIALEQALTQLLERHESLRTNFVLENGQPRQIIQPAGAFNLTINIWEHSDAATLSAYVQAHAHKVFDLTKDVLLKVELLELGDKEYILLFNMHHIISDGWSIGILFKELNVLYQAIDSGQSAKLAPLQIQYKDYAAWQHQLLSDNETMDALRTYWQEKLANLATLELPTDFPRPNVKTYQGTNLVYKFKEQLLSQLETLSRANGATLFMTLTAIVKILLYRYSGQEDIILGTPSAGRNHPDLHDQIGYYINTVVLRDHLAPNDSFTDTLVKVKQTALAAFERELYPFDQLVEELALDRDMSRSPIFDVMLVLQNNEQSELKLGATKLSVLASPFEVSKFDLTINFAQGMDGLEMGIEYNTSLFKEATIGRMIQHLETLITNVLVNPSVAIGQVNILPNAEKELIQHTFNDTKADFPANKTIIDLFEAQVQKTPDKIAVIFDSDSNRDRIQLTYKELNEQANRVGHYLRETYDIQPDDIIALQLDRSEWMIIAILGVMKAGGAYLPIAPDNPKARTEYMLRDSQAKVLLTDEATYEFVKAVENTSKIEVIEQIKGEKRINLQLETRNSKNLAYIIYTSGSTGMPKGVMIEHRALMNFLFSMQKTPGMEQQDILLSITNYTFDISILEFGLPLIIGAQLVVASSSQQKDVALLKSLIEKTKPTFLQATPSLWSILLSNDMGIFQKMKLLCGGEALPEQLAEKLLKAGNTVWNMYGPTETTIWSSTLKLVEKEHISIGQPIANTDLYILAKDLTILPIGIAGELYIGGAGLARGYLNNPTLTAEKFIPHPFLPPTPSKGGERQRLYKTGDLARWLPDGNIEFLGRIDHQLKVRGYRIETGEIEEALLAHTDIQSAVVIGYKQEGQATELVAYLVSAPTIAIPSIEKLRSHLAQSLPAYMIPAYFVELESLPLNSSGKVNRKALPAPQATQLVAGTTYVAPRNKKEATLADIWESILQREGIGIHDNFFDLGGHSLKAIQLVGLVQQQLQIDINLSAIFKYPTIAAMAQQLKKGGLQSEQAGMFLTQKSEQSIFTFPPILGLGIIFKDLADLINTANIYAFDFIPKADKLERYYLEIKAQQAHGPYTLMGYSAGGNLAFEMVKYMEAKGEIIQDLILIDSYVLLSEQVRAAAEIAAEMQLELDYIEVNPHLVAFKNLISQEWTEEQISNRRAAFTEYFGQLKTKGTIKSNIHLLYAPEENKKLTMEDTRPLWRAHTQGVFQKHIGKGEHVALLVPPNIKYNTAIVNKIMASSQNDSVMQVQNNSAAEIRIEQGIPAAYRLLKAQQQLVGLKDRETALPQEIEQLKVALANYEEVASKLVNVREQTIEWFQLQQNSELLEKNIENLKQQVLLLEK